MISVIAKIPLQDGKADEFTKAFHVIAKGVATEKENYLYSLNFSEEEPNIAVIMERYENRDALTAHSQSDHYKAFGPSLKGIVAGKAEVVVMDEVAIA